MCVFISDSLESEGIRCVISRAGCWSNPEVELKEMFALARFCLFYKRLVTVVLQKKSCGANGLRSSVRRTGPTIFSSSCGCTKNGASDKNIGWASSSFCTPKLQSLSDCLNWVMKQELFRGILICRIFVWPCVGKKLTASMVLIDSSFQPKLKLK